MEKLTKAELEEFNKSYMEYLAELEEQKDLDTILDQMYLQQR